MKKTIVLIIAVLLVASGIFIHTKNLRSKSQKIQDEKKQIKEIQAHYNDVVLTNDISSLYKLDNNNYVEYGTIGKDIVLNLDNETIDKDTEYFHISDMNLYIPYKSVVPAQKDEVYVNENYKKYVKFNENVVTENETSFYDDNGLYLKINEGVSLPIIIKEKNKYYVEYNNKLLYIKKSESTTKKNNNTKEETRSKITVLTYHSIYKKEQKCTNTVICHPYKQFDEHMKYLSKNNYLTLTMKDLELFLDGKIRIPKKSIVITLDDGKYFKNAVEVV